MELFYIPCRLSLCAIVYSMSSLAAPYVEYKRNDTLLTGKTSEFMRVGYQFEKNFYGEIGRDSSEIGYKFKPVKNFTIKGKVERVNGKDKLETEVRYTFK